MWKRDDFCHRKFGGRESDILYLYPATTLEEAYEISDVLYPGMLGK